jgi:hypothetical protein
MRLLTAARQALGQRYRSERGLEHEVPLIGAMTTRNFDEVA